MKLRRTQSNLEDDIDDDDNECEDDGVRDDEQESDTESGGSIKILAVVKNKRLLLIPTKQLAKKEQRLPK